MTKNSERDSFDLTPQQYHAGLDQLWKALELYDVQDEDVFTLTVKKINELQKIVDQLHKTDDGVSVTPGMKIYTIEPTGYVQGLNVTGMAKTTDSSLPEPCYIPTKHCYSTQAAAEKAWTKKKTQEQEMEE